MKAVALNLILAQSIQTATAHPFIYQPGYGNDFNGKCG